MLIAAKDHDRNVLMAQGPRLNQVTPAPNIAPPTSSNSLAFLIFFWYIRHRKTYNDTSQHHIPQPQVQNMGAVNSFWGIRPNSDSHIPGGKLCFNLSAFSESFNTSVYRKREHRTLNLI